MTSESLLQAVPIFAAGNRRGKEYTTADLDAIVAEFQTTKRDIPLVLGHSEEQALLRDSGLPSAGWCDNLYRQGGQLLADFRGVPEPVRRLLKGRAYRKVSAEIYPDMRLRRVAALGADIPEIKTLGDIPIPEHFTEQPFAPVRLDFVSQSPGGYYTCFSEAMNRERMLQLLAEMGMDLSQVTDAVTDGLLAEMVRVLDAKHDAAADAEDEAEEAAEEAKKASEKAKNGADDPAKLKAERFRESEDEMTAEEIQAAVQDAVAKELAKIKMPDVAGEVKRLEKFAEKARQEQTRLVIEPFCESCVKEGYLLPADVDANNPASAKARLYRAASMPGVVKFAEADGKEVELTELEIQMKEIRSRPPFKFGERMKSPADKQGGEDAEVAQVEQHYEAYAEQFDKNGMTKEALVNGFKAERKVRPNLRARDFISV